MQTHTEETENRIIELLRQLVQRRGENRTVIKQRVTNAIIIYVTEQCNGVIRRAWVSSLLRRATPQTQERQIRNNTLELLNYLLNEGTVKEQRTREVKHAFYNKPLLSWDYGSYAVLMKKWKEGSVKGCVTNSNKSVCRVPIVSHTLNYIVA